MGSESPKLQVGVCSRIELWHAEEEMTERETKKKRLAKRRKEKKAGFDTCVMS